MCSNDDGYNKVSKFGIFVCGCNFCGGEEQGKQLCEKGGKLVGDPTDLGYSLMIIYHTHQTEVQEVECLDELQSDECDVTNASKRYTANHFQTTCCLLVYAVAPLVPLRK